MRTEAALFLIIPLIVIFTFPIDLESQESQNLFQPDFSDDRANLKIPQELWTYILSNVGHDSKTLGYTFEEKKLRLRVSGEYEASDGFREGGSFLWPLDDDYKAGRIGFKAVYAANPNDIITLSAGSSLMVQLCTCTGLWPRAQESRYPGQLSSGQVGTPHFS